MTESKTELTAEPKIAYFSMEIGLQPDIPTYCGGLGVLAGDTIRSASDLQLPVVAVTLISRKGYFTQVLREDGWQVEHAADWEPDAFMELLPARVTVSIEGREVSVRAWRFDVVSPTGGTIPILYLDTSGEENDPRDQGITDTLYGGDSRYRLKQEIVLGLGGYRMLHELGVQVKKYHMNEGHASLLTVDLLTRSKRDIERVWDESLVWDYDAVRDLCMFTTHTPVEAGHDHFDYGMVREVLGEPIPLEVLKGLAGNDVLNMTVLALNLSSYVNGVAKKHGEVSKEMFRGYAIHSITNGVHSFTWTSEPFRELYDRYIPGWANEPELLVRVDIIPDDDIWTAHQKAKGRLMNLVQERTGTQMDPDVLTIGFARRAATYKRADLLFRDMDRLRNLGKGRLQIIYAGKSHPRDQLGKEMIQRVVRAMRELGDDVKTAYLAGYDIGLAKILVPGVDVWLNNPIRPHEASGTSGMKAAHNGVPNFSVLDGWWIEGHIEGITGWSIGPLPKESTLSEATDKEDVADLYHKLETVLLPLYYGRRSGWIAVMKNAIGKNAYYFNTHRMMRRYVTEGYIR